jgi:hypothetical protein
MSGRGANRKIQRDIGARVQLIRIVDNVLAFFTLIILVIEATLFAMAAVATGQDRLTIIYLGCAIVVFTILSLLSIVFFKPEVLQYKIGVAANGGVASLAEKTRDNFPHLLGWRFSRALSPYLLNLPVDEMDEALSNVEGLLTDISGFNKEETEFARTFSAAVINEGKAFLKIRRLGNNTQP